MAEAGSLWVKLGLRDKQFNQGIDKANAKAKGFGKSMAGLGPIMAAGFAIAAAATIKLGKEVYTLQANYSSMMSRVQALTGASDNLTDKLSRQAQVLGKKTQFTATQAAEAMGFLAQAGLKVDQIYKAMPNTLELAAAGQISLAEAADISTNVMNAYGLAAEELGRGE